MKRFVKIILSFLLPAIVMAGCTSDIEELLSFEKAQSAVLLFQVIASFAVFGMVNVGAMPSVIEVRSSVV